MTNIDINRIFVIELFMNDSFNYKNDPNLKKYELVIKRLEREIDKNKEWFLIIGNDGKVIHISDSVEKIIGYKKDDFYKNPLKHFEIIDKEDKKLLYRKLIGNDIPSSSPFGCVFKINDKSGGKKLLQQKCTYILKENGEIDAWIIILTDMSGKKRYISEEIKNSSFFYELLQSSPIGVVYCDINGNVLYVNQKTLDILGSPSEKETLKINLFNFPPLIKSGIAGKIRESISTGDGKKGKNWYISKWGKKIYVRYHVKPILDESGEIEGALILLENFTEAKKAKDALFKAQNEYRKMLNLFELGAANIEDLLWAKDLKRRYIFSNKAYNEFLFGKNTRKRVDGYKDETISKKVTGLIAVKDNLNKTLKFSYTTDMEVFEKKKTLRYELEFEKENGDKEIFYISKSPIFDKRGKVIGLVGSGKIITAIKNLSEDKRRAEKERDIFEKLIGQVRESIVITDLDGNIEFVNPFFEKITGYKFSEVKGKNPRVLKSEKHDEKFYKNMWNTILEGKVWHDIMINKKKNGEIYNEDSLIFPLKGENGEIVNFVAVKRDITEEIKLKEQLFQSQKMEAMGQLLSGVVHDFNNILTVINGYSEMGLKSVGKNSKLEKIFKTINDTGKKAKSLVSHLLAFSRKQVLNKKIVYINEVIENMRKILKSLVGDDIELEFKLGEKIKHIKADSSKIEQIILNLVVNARDAIRESNKEKRKITISTENSIVKSKSEGRKIKTEYLLLKIEDSGTGIDDKIINKIFDPFFTTKEKGKGTGLGLSTVYKIVKEHKGFIDVESEIGKGTAFLIYFPIVKDAKDYRDEDKTEQQIIKGKGEKILLVEDDPMLLNLQKDLIKELGYVPIIATNGKDALKIFSNWGTIDLVITDLIMPKLRGEDLINKVKEKNPNQKILIVTGSVKQETVNEIKKSEGIDFLEKPYTVSGLSKKIHNLLK